MTDFWIWVDTVSGVILPNIDWHIIYIHHEAILDIYLFGIIVVFGVLCFLGLVWWIVIDPCIRFFRMPHLKCKIRSDHECRVVDDDSSALAWRPSPAGQQVFC